MFFRQPSRVRRAVSPQDETRVLFRGVKEASQRLHDFALALAYALGMAEQDATVRKLQATKAEHRAILQVILADGGMAAETRRTLVDHLMEEEEELVNALSADGMSTSGPRGGDGADGLPAFTVGSLRAEV